MMRVRISFILPSVALITGLSPPPIGKGLGDCSVIGQALQLATRLHDGQQRRDGQPFVTHPIAVAQLMRAWRMDTELVTAALLHDTVEDTPFTFMALEATFGDDVRRLVEGVTRPSKLASTRQSGQDPAGQDELQLLEACARDWRVGVLKLGDRVHNMRTLGAMPASKQAEKALETKELYVPLAHFLGWHVVGAELSDLVQQYLHPQNSGTTSTVTRASLRADSERGANYGTESSLLARGWMLSETAAHSSMPPAHLERGLREQQRQSHSELLRVGGQRTPGVRRGHASGFWGG